MYFEFVSMTITMSVNSSVLKFLFIYISITLPVLLFCMLRCRLCSFILTVIQVVANLSGGKCVPLVQLHVYFTHYIYISSFALSTTNTIIRLGFLADSARSLCFIYVGKHRDDKLYKVLCLVTVLYAV